MTISEKKFLEFAISEVEDAWDSAYENAEEQIKDLDLDGQDYDSQLIHEMWNRNAIQEQNYWIDVAKSRNASPETVLAISKA